MSSRGDRESQPRGERAKGSIIAPDASRVARERSEHGRDRRGRASAGAITHVSMWYEPLSLTSKPRKLVLSAAPLSSSSDDEVSLA